ncbi:unnamed protein product [Adineta ricciae]|uniref:Caspase family p20 domain-containing protein n=1 Tax=Adineta ricciae TaxID=249248 RepID=A0A814BWY4_ADIRI|nr:unnamed protein product [Adineta ricciae]
MSNITKETINQCSIRLGSFNSATVDTLVYFFHHQDGCVQLTSATNNLKEKFENLLTVQENEDDNDTPWTRIELAVMLHFKAKYLEQNVISNEANQLKAKRKLSLGDELDLAYAFLLAQVNDRLSLNTHIKDLMFLMELPGDACDLYDVYRKSSQDFSNFFCSIIQCDYLSKKIALVDLIIRNFQSFIKRYEDFLITYDKFYKPIPENRSECTLLDEMMNTVDIQEDPSLGITIFPITSEKPKPPTLVSDTQSPNISKPLPVVQQPQPAPPSSSASNTSQKGLCVIINIQSFMKSAEITAKYRTGSDVDVENIRVVFKKSGFRVMICTHDFKKADVDTSLEQFNDKDKYGQCDCFVMFIMSHGFLNSFLTTDQKIVNIRDIIKQYSDSSPTTIWAGKPRLFFIQACRSLSSWPEYLRCSSGQESS